MSWIKHYTLGLTLTLVRKVARSVVIFLYIFMMYNLKSVCIFIMDTITICS